MFTVTKQPQKFANFSLLLLNRNQKRLNVVKPCVFFMTYSSQVKLYGCTPNRDLLLSNAQCINIISRQKSKGRKGNVQSRKRNIKEDDESDDDDDEENEEDEYIEDGALVKTYNLNSLRIDLILKQVLTQKRKKLFHIFREWRKIEEFFYNNKIRVNGKILLKKAGNANVGDEIDLIKGTSKNNSELIEVSRVEILDIEEDSDSQKYLLKIKKYKTLEIDNYPEGDTWKEPEAEV